MEKIKLKIVKILNSLPDWQPEGKKYVVRSWNVIADRDGKQAQILLKTLCKQELKEGNIVDVEQSEYNGKMQFMWKPEKQEYTGNYKRPVQKKWTWSQFAILVNQCRVLSVKEGEFEKILGCASVLVDPEKLGE